MVDSSLMRGEYWIRCTICGQLHLHPYYHLAIDEEGNCWDVCKGECAKDAGIVEKAKCEECGGEGSYWTEWSDRADRDPELSASVMHRPEPPDGTVLFRCHKCKGYGYATNST